MSEQLLFHEKCNHDIRAILDTIARRTELSKDQLNEFRLRLTETYQMIFENPSVSSGHVFEPEISWGDRIEKRFVKVHGFPYLVVYTILSKKTTVILGIISSITNHLPPFRLNT